MVCAARFFALIVLPLAAISLSSRVTAQPVEQANKRIYFGTDRTIAQGTANPTVGSESSGKLVLGRSSFPVSPSGDGKGALAPTNEPLSQEQFTQDISKELEQSMHQALVFIPGKGTSFDKSLEAVARFTSQAHYSGMPILYSWPTEDGAAYDRDRASALAATPFVDALIKLTMEQPNAKRISIVALGMGARPLLDSLTGLWSTRDAGLSKIANVILIVPDVERSVFESAVAELKGSGIRITIYVSGQAPDIQAARSAGGEARAGDVTPNGPLVVSGVDTIEMGDTETSFELNHSDFGEPETVATDIGKAIARGPGPPDSRSMEMRRVGEAEGTYWQFGKPAPPTGETYTAVPVFFGTDRLKVAGTEKIAFGGDRSDQLSLGRAVVTVPKEHQIERGVERPTWWDIFSTRSWFDMLRGLNPFREDPNKHFVLYDISLLGEDEFIRLVRQRMVQAKLFSGHAFVFIHGYNVSFENALFRTAQVAYDLGFDGVPFLYSWPSGGALKDYIYDRDSADLTVDSLVEFVKLVMAKSGAENVHLIAHSLGNDPLLKTLNRLATDPPPYLNINQIILAAPDIDKDRFAKLAKEIARVGHNKTMYASSKDVALIAARTAARDIARAGDVPADGPIMVAGVDTIDASATSTALFALNHSSYAESTALLEDMKLLLREGKSPPDQRTKGLEIVPARGSVYWRFPSENPKAP